MMKERMNDNKTLILLLGILALVILGALYYYVVYPKMEHEKRIASSIEQLAVDNRHLKEDILAYAELDEDAEDTFDLRKKLPGNRNVSELLLSLEEAELVSEAKIQSIAFNNYDGLVSESGYGVTGEEDVDEAGETEGQEDDEIPETKIDIETLPTALKLLSFNVQVEVQDYDHLLTFIREVEAIERLKRIEDIAFSSGGEAELKGAEADEAMVVTLQVTTFYSEEEAD